MARTCARCGRVQASTEDETETRCEACDAAVVADDEPAASRDATASASASASDDGETTTTRTWNAFAGDAMCAVASASFRGLVVVAGAAAGAVAAAIAARATRRSVLASVGVGAVTGAATAFDWATFVGRATPLELRIAYRALRVSASRAGSFSSRYPRDRTADVLARALESVRANGIERSLANGDVERAVREIISHFFRTPRERRRLWRFLEALETHGAMTSLVAADVDAMTYEELLETFGPGVEGVAGAPAAAIDAVPTSTLAADYAWKDAISDVEASSCRVCLDEFRVGEKVKALPSCGHRFHAPCIDKWLLGRNACPMCRVGLPETLCAMATGVSASAASAAAAGSAAGSRGEEEDVVAAAVAPSSAGWFEWARPSVVAPSSWFGRGRDR